MILLLFAAAPDDPSVKAVIGTLIEKNGVSERTNIGGIRYVGAPPPQGKVYRS